MLVFLWAEEYKPEIENSAANVNVYRSRVQFVETDIILLAHKLGTQNMKYLVPILDLTPYTKSPN
jgi:hypothetical protein